MRGWTRIHAGWKLHESAWETHFDELVFFSIAIHLWRWKGGHFIGVTQHPAWAHESAWGLAPCRLLRGFFHEGRQPVRVRASRRPVFGGRAWETSGGRVFSCFHKCLVHSYSLRACWPAWRVISGPVMSSWRPGVVTKFRAHYITWTKMNSNENTFSYRVLNLVQHSIRVCLKNSKESQNMWI